MYLCLLKWHAECRSFITEWQRKKKMPIRCRLQKLLKLIWFAYSCQHMDQKSKLNCNFAPFYCFSLVRLVWRLFLFPSLSYRSSSELICIHVLYYIIRTKRAFYIYLCIISPQVCDPSFRGPTQTNRNCSIRKGKFRERNLKRDD